MYIIVVNPAILSQAGMPFSGVLTATVLLSFFCSLMMGVYAKNPLIVAPGMGLNAFFTFTAVKGLGIAWETALGAVFWSGVLFLLAFFVKCPNAFAPGHSQCAASCHRGGHRPFHRPDRLHQCRIHRG